MQLTPSIMFQNKRLFCCGKGEKKARLRFDCYFSDLVHLGSSKWRYFQEGATDYSGGFGFNPNTLMVLGVFKSAGV